MVLRIALISSLALTLGLAVGCSDDANTATTSAAQGSGGSGGAAQGGGGSAQGGNAQGGNAQGGNAQGGNGQGGAGGGPVTCSAASPCGDGFFCDYQPSNCGANDAEGVCEPEPAGCHDIAQPTSG